MTAVSGTSRTLSQSTQAIIDLSACRHNLSQAKKLAPDAKYIAIIKANAYGHGMLQIAQALNDADAFGVARIAEAIQLREAGITTPILLLEGFTTFDELNLVRQYNLECVLHHASQIQLFEEWSEAEGEKISVWLKIDTGMNRLGINPENLHSVIKRLDQCAVVNQSIKYMTHLANADDKHDNKTLKQIEIFYQSIAEFADTETSIANSAGILGWPQSHTSWHRPGILLYGVSPFLHGHASDHNLKAVMTLSSKLISVKKIKKGEAIGYGGSYVCEKDLTIGVVAIGYGDGYPRHAKTGTPVLVNGKRTRLLGRVSMDMISVDLCEQTEAKVNAPVVLWGNGLAIEEVAAAADTIAYDLLCGVTNRVEFVYLDL